MKFFISVLALSLRVNSKSEGFDQKIGDMVEWMKEQGAYFSDIEIRESRDNLMRGVFAKSDIKRGDILVFVPYNALLDMNSIQNTTLGEKMEASQPIADHEFAAADILALLLLQQKDLG